MGLVNFKKAPLIFVYGGKFPEYGNESVIFNGKHSKKNIILLCNKNQTNFKITNNIKLFDYDEFNDDRLFFLKKIKKLNKFRSSFWILSIERYFVLLKFVNKLKINSFFHGELDNVFFNLSNVDSKLNKFGRKFFFPIDNKKGFGSIVYINSTKILEQFCEYALSQLEKKFYNDMELLFMFSKKFPQHTKFLPTEKSVFLKKNNNTLDYKFTKGIFDAARIGQYLFGVDPRNIKGNLYNKVIIDDKKVIKKKLKKYYDNCKFYFDNQKFYFKFYKKKINIFNLHIHSKLIKDIFTKKNYKNILDNINNNRSSQLFTSSKFDKFFNFLN